MTDMDELIAEARKLIAHTKTYNFGMWSADKLAHEVAGGLADALESVRAGRDAALAAIARVRAIHRPTLPGYGPKACVHDGRGWPCKTMSALNQTQKENQNEKKVRTN